MYLTCRERKASSAVQKISDYKAKEKARMDVSVTNTFHFQISIASITSGKDNVIGVWCFFPCRLYWKWLKQIRKKEQCGDMTVCTSQ